MNDIQDAILSEDSKKIIFYGPGGILATEDKTVCAKTVTYMRTNRTDYWARMLHNRLINANDTDSFKARSGDYRWVRINQPAFELYVKFLVNKRAALLHQAERVV